MKVTAITRAMRKFLPLDYCGAVIVAAGNATRMGGIDKVIAPLAGEPVILRTARAFQECEAIREIVIVTRPELILPVTELCRQLPKVTAVLAGGATRQESVELGLRGLSGRVRLAAVHDGARPLVSWQLIDRVVRAAHTYGAAAPAVGVKDTIKVAGGGLAVSTPDRAGLRAIQTPQVFDTAILRAALHKAKKDQVLYTDDCAAVERLGMKIKLVPGDERNLKITTPTDLKLAALLWEETI